MNMAVTGRCEEKENVNLKKIKSEVISDKFTRPISLENYKKGDQILYGLQNLSDPDLDILYYSISGNLIESVNVITKLLSDHNAVRRRREGVFGENIKK